MLYPAELRARWAERILARVAAAYRRHGTALTARPWHGILLGMITQDQETQAQITPEGARAMLAEGNQRFLERKAINRDLLKQVELTAGGQAPFAVVLSCIDSRVPAEMVFDQGIGDIFSARIAGNFVNEDLLGSMEFATKLAVSKLVLVLGHSACGAVGALLVFLVGARGAVGDFVVFWGSARRRLFGVVRVRIGSVSPPTTLHCLLIAPNGLYKTQTILPSPSL